MLGGRDGARARAARRVPLPAQRGRPAHRRARCSRAAAAPGRAGTTTCSTRPARQADRHLPHEPPAVAARRPRVLRHAQPHRGDRPGADHPHDRTTRTRSSPAPGEAAQARHARDQRRAAARTSAAPTGAGASTRTASSAASRVAERRSGRRLRMTRQRALRGQRPPPPLRGARARVPPPRSRMAYLDLDELPRLLGGRLVAPRPGLVRFRRVRPPRRSRAPAGRRDPRRSSRSAPARRARRPDAPAHPAAHRSATASTRSASTTASTPTSALGAVVAEVTSTPWGERHAYVLAREGGERVLGGEHRQAPARLAVHGHGPALRLARRTTPGRRRCRCTSRAARAASGRSTPRSASTRVPLTRRTLARSIAALPGGHAARARR